MVEWNRPNGRSELEATSVKRVVVKGSVEAGAMAEMQYKGEIWSGKILSLHGKCKCSCKSLRTVNHVRKK